MHRFIASWFGTGLILGRLRGSDSGSGTVASVVTFPFAFWLGTTLGWQAQLAAAVVITGLSLWSAQAFAEDQADPGWIVVDEAAGMMVSLIGLSLIPAVGALLVFRLADITKKFPGVTAAERLHGAVGITLDDVVAGLWALGAGWVLQGIL